MEAAAANNASFIPSARDLILVIPRLAQRASSFALFHMPDAMDNIAGKIFNGGSVIADATSQSTTADSTITNASSFAQSTAAALEATFREAWTDGEDRGSSIFMSIVQVIGKLKNFGGIFSYLTSRWALTTFTAAILLNRTQFYASSREHLRLRWHMRLALYAIPIAAFLTQMVVILEAMRCQTSPDFPQLRYGDPLKHLAIDFAGEGGFLYNLSSTLLFWKDDVSCCQARQMSLLGLEDDKSALRGSMSLLYWFFITLCTSQLFETLCCALQGKQPMPETGMTIFEHSLAFAECEAMISSALGFGFFGIKGGDPVGSSGSDGTGSPLISRSEILQRLNVPPEVLLVCLISCFSHLSSASLAVTGIRHKVRLVNTGIWACCYMSAFIWSFAKIFTSPLDHIADLGVLRFPTVCIVGFIPHLLILIGISVCAAIYGLAIFITALSVPQDAAEGLNFRQRLSWAYNNLQANVQFSQSSSIRIKMSEDFYTTLLKIGFNVLTAASEAVYLNEGSRIHVAQMTWLEQKRIDELAASADKRKAPAVPLELLGEGIARGVGFVDTQNAAISQSPYARERKSRPTKSEVDKPNAVEMDSGLGMSQRRSRMQLTFDFIAGIFWLLISLQAQLLLNLLRRVGVEHRPSWLLKAACVVQGQRRPSAHNRPTQFDFQEFNIVESDGSFRIPRDNNFDVETETRRRKQAQGTYRDEQQISDAVYRWWHTGGRFGDLDESGDYQSEAGQDDDLTSVISMSTNASTTDDIAESGRRTPTQTDPFGERSRESTPASSDAGLDFSSLSRLLDPRSKADQEEARMLSYSLQSSRPMTRSQYRRNQDRSRAEILTGLRAGNSVQHVTEEDEERELEKFVLAKRQQTKTRAQKSNTWESGAEGMGEGGPQCVVCQSSPRTILVWPCGCLSMCDDCRVGLAARNYTKCICCRTDIAAYSRLYVP
ncbi:related to ASI3 integral membrane E3 ubiquitin ligase, role in negative regulation of amino acid uptake [Lecanosticta acicola]|uniref:Related to ASI3 integral membrane E3 ubiquitin ligase, role in negative regulation of amino acid uptake n=1 Tax=Lecanosticta acicola TaxID=111012 RepID=A0AAI8YVI3_9PEZI|nr:related to ASI3 integral membrane E3 ubiquitin ligase, role in negative regulation of amino acid uptake [Lecanosticta acicola]